jgi:glycosyltransferase involved in cell wall biosynthesis
MRIILTTHLFLPESSGGTETLVHGIASNLLQKGHSVLVVTGSDDKDPVDASNGFDEYTLDAIRVVRFRRHRISAGRESNPLRADYDNREFEEGFRRLLREFMPDVVHFHHFGRSSIKIVDACNQEKIPSFLTVTDFWPICPQQALLLPDGRICNGPTMGSANCLKHMVELTQPKWLAGTVKAMPNSALALVTGTLKHIDFELPGVLGVTQALAKRKSTIASSFPFLTKIFVPTRHAQTTLEKNGIAAGNFRILPFGLRDHGYVKRIRTRGEHALSLGFIGQFLPHKGLHVLTEALRLLPADCPVNIKVYAKLPAKETQYVRDFFAHAQEDRRLTYEGTFDNEKIPVVLDGIDALVIPSIWHENMPLVSLSAQAAGCPLIASDVGGLSDIISHGENGLLFSPGSAHALRDCILQLLSDKNMLSHLSSSAIAPYTLNQYVGTLESEYLQAIGERK